MLDLLIKNGTVVDGTGASGRQADVAIQGGKIATIGKVTESDQRVLNASDLKDFKNCTRTVTVFV